jgi:CheY-like chemotaxis protein
MIAPWTAPGNHAVQFYDTEQAIYRTIAEYFVQGTDSRDPLILVSRPRTFSAVAEHLSCGRYGPALDVADRILFVDAEAALPQIMEGEIFNPARAEYLFKHVLAGARLKDPNGTIRLYGEIVDMLCQHGRYATALEFERIAGVLLDLEPRLSILCGYATERFEGDANAAQLRAICQKHTHVLPPEGSNHALCEGATHPEAVMLPHNVLDRALAVAQMQASHGTTSARTIYVIDDDVSLRRALGRLLTASNWPMRTFDSAEAFLEELGELSNGCLVVDIQLPGMSGLELVRRLTDARLSWPIVVMSALDDKTLEANALRLGARAYLRKPFDCRILLDVIGSAIVASTIPPT